MMGKILYIKNIHEVEQGSLLQINNSNSISSKKFFDVKSIFKKKDQYINIQDALKETITKHMLADVKLSSHLSGGLDSSIVASIASKANPSYKLNCYTGYFSEKGYSELEYANELKKLNSNIINNNIQITSKQYIENFENFFNYLDYPLAGIGSLNQYILNKEISKKFKSGIIWPWR